MYRKMKKLAKMAKSWGTKFRGILRTLLERAHLIPNRMIIEGVTIDPADHRRVQLRYRLSGEWKRYIECRKPCFIEYCVPVNDVPESVLVVPFLANFLPLAWVKDAVVEVPVCDKAFADAIPLIRQGYADMYPEQSFRAKIRIGRTEVNPCRSENKRTAALFSGGLDATATLLRHLDEIDDLFMIFGADVNCRNQTGIANMKKILQDASEQFGKNGLWCRTSIRKVLRKKKLDPLVKHPGETWWHGYHHGISMLSMLAPLAWIYGISTLYIASSFTKGQAHVCASDPTIDNHMSYCGCRVIHDAYELDRSDKIRLVGKYAEATGNNLYIRACIKSKEALNCCKCEKCIRTILGFWSCGYDPKRFGFQQYGSVDELGKALYKKLPRCRQKFQPRYEPVQKSMQETYSRDEVPENLRWLYDFDFQNMTDAEIKEYFTDPALKNSTSP